MNIGAQTAVSLTALAATVNGHTAATGIIATVNSAAVNGHAAGTILTFTTEVGSGTTTGATSTVSGTSVSAPGSIVDNIATQFNTTGIVSKLGTLGTLSVNSATDQVGGTLLINSGTSTYGGAIALAAVSTNLHQTLAQIADDFNSTATGGAGTTQVLNGGTALNNLGIQATLNATGTEITFTQKSGTANNVNTASVQIGLTTATVPFASAANTASTTLTATNVGNTFTGTITGTTTADGVLSRSVNGLTLAQIADNFNNTQAYSTTTKSDWSADGLTATLSGNVLTLTASGTTNAAITGGTLTENLTTDTIDGATKAASNSTTLTATNATDLFQGTIAGVNGSSVAYGESVNGLTLAQIADNFKDSNTYTTGTVTDWSGSGITASLTGNVLTLTPNATNSTVTAGTVTEGVGGGVLTEAPTVTYGASLGSLTATNASDTLSGAFSIQSGFTSGSAPITFNFTGQTLAQIEQTIDTGNYGITATLNQAVNNTSGNGKVLADTVLTFTQNAADGGRLLSPIMG